MRGSLMLGLTALVGVTACDGLFNPDRLPPTDLGRGSLPGTVVVGQAIQVDVTVEDRKGRAVRGEDVTWAPVGGGTVSPATSSTDDDGVARTAWTLGTEAGPQTLTAKVRELETTFAVTAEPGPVTGVAITPDGGTLASLGDSLPLSAAATDAYGNAVPLDGLTWSSNAPAVAEVTPAGVVVSRSEGEAVVTGTLGGVATSVTVTVDQVVVGLAVDLWTSVLARSEAYQLGVRAIDARGATADTTLAVTWSTSAPAVATVDPGGLLEAVDVGDAVITATAGTLSGELTVTVKAGPRPTVTGITPDVLSPGGTATITGTGFSATPSLNAVTIAGQAATVDAATATELLVTLPPSGSFPCGSTALYPVEVETGGLSVVTDHPLAGAPRHQLAVGEAVVLDAFGLGCNEVVEPGSYVMTVFNTSTAPGSSTAFQVRGSTGATTAAAPSIAAFAYTPTLRVEASPLPDRDVDPGVAAHLRMVERNRALFDHLGPPPAPAATQGLSSVQVSAEPAVGDLRTFRIPDLDTSSLCTSYDAVTARVVYAGTRGVIYEDTLAPLAGSMDAHWQELGTEFDQVMYPVLTEYIGDPLAVDAQLDGDGRFNMLFSKVVNDMDAEVAGFVFSGDFYPRRDCASSDEGEIFYGRVPTTPGSGYDGDTPDSWAWGIRSTVIHEVKHITSYATKLRDAGAGAPNFEDQWLEESTARLAEEYYARALFGYGQGDNVSYQESIYGEIRVGANWPQYDEFPSIMVKHFSGVNDYLKSIENLSPVGKTAEGDWTYYGSGWLFVRWAIDQSGAPESSFTRALVDEDGVTGVANIVARTGRSFRELLGDFSLALAVDDHPSGVLAADPAHAHPSWDTRSIFAGLNQDYAGTALAQRFDRPWPLQARVLPAGAFEAEVPILRGGTTTVFELTVDVGQPRLIRVLGASGGTAPSVLGMALMRVQ